MAAQKFLATLGSYTTTKSGIKYLITKKGTGPTPKTGQEVKVLYKGTLLDGTVFDQNQDIQNPLKFAIGMRQVIPGWDEAFMLLHEGDEATLVIPSELAYGQQGGGPIPPSSTLVFEVKLLKVGDKPKK
jgi:FKBP-type peptidyl-prolyl cis-trans isomerase